MRSEPVAAALLAAVGLALVAWAGSEAQDSLRANAWPPVPAVIEESRGSSNKPAIDDFHLSYRYEVGGVAHVGHRLAFGDNHLDGTERAKRFRVGDTVTAYVDPMDPERAILVRGIGFETYFTVGVALVLFAFAAGQLRMARST